MLIIARLPWSKKHFLKANFRLLEFFGYKMDNKRWTRAQYWRSYFGRSLLMGLTIYCAVYNFYDIFSNIAKDRVVQGIQAISLPSMAITAIIAHLHFIVYKTELDTLFGQIDDMVKFSLRLSPAISKPRLDKYSFISNLLIVLLYLTIPLAGMTNLQTPLIYLIQNGAQSNYSEIPMPFEVYYGTEPREDPKMFWLIAIIQTLQMMFSLAYFVPVLSCYFSIIYFLQSMNEITNLFFSHFFISAQDTDNPYNPEMIPFRGVLLLHQKLLRTMEMFADIMAAPLFAAFTFGVAYLALAFFEIVMYGFDPQNSKAAIMIMMSLAVTFCVMWFFQTISELTSHPLRALYFRPWYRIRDQKFLENFKFVMLRTSKEVKYTLGGLSTEATMDTYINLLKCAFSYTSLLKETKKRIDKA
ncbi:hypothetical protein M8J76_013490 [Diaphorina citri]|nr:hypothetical protein M8J76_013490 [Diaphorina citri]